MSHFSGRPESGSLKISLEEQEARQKPHSSYSFPSMMYLSLPMHSAGACITGVTGMIYIAQGVAHQSDAGPCRVVAAVFRRGVKGGADHLARPAAIAFIRINLDCFDLFLNFAHLF